MIDDHVHVNLADTTPADVLAYMDEFRIDHCVLLAVENRDRGQGSHTQKALTGRPPILNCEVWAVANAYPERFTPFFTVDPRDADVQMKIERYARLGFRGFGEHKVENVPFDAPGCQRIYEACQALGLPILFHLGKVGFDEADIDAVERMVARYSSLTFIAHSMGWWKHISKVWDPDDDYPDAPVVPGGHVDRLLAEYPNLFADLSGPEGLIALARDVAYADGFLDRHRTKVMFGTDFPCEVFGPHDLFANQINWRRKLVFGLADSSPLPDPYMAVVRLLMADPMLFRAVTHANAARILALPDTSPAGQKTTARGR